MKKIHKKTESLLITVDPSNVSVIPLPEYLLPMDRIIMKNGGEYLVNKIENGEIELQLLTRIKHNKESVQEFLKDLLHVKRADCFEID
jgi:ribosomal protein L21E